MGIKIWLNLIKLTWFFWTFLLHMFIKYSIILYCYNILYIHGSLIYLNLFLLDKTFRWIVMWCQSVNFLEITCPPTPCNYPGLLNFVWSSRFNYWRAMPILILATFYFVYYGLNLGQYVECTSRFYWK